MLYINNYDCTAGFYVKTDLSGSYFLSMEAMFRPLSLGHHQVYSYETIRGKESVYAVVILPRYEIPLKSVLVHGRTRTEGRIYFIQNLAVKYVSVHCMH